MPGDHKSDQAVQRISGSLWEKPIPVPIIRPGGTASGLRQVGKTQTEHFSLDATANRVFITKAFEHGHYVVLSLSCQAKCNLWRNLHAEQTGG